RSARRVRDDQRQHPRGGPGGGRRHGRAVFPLAAPDRSSVPGPRLRGGHDRRRRRIPPDAAKRRCPAHELQGRRGVAAAVLPALRIRADGRPEVGRGSSSARPDRPPRGRERGPSLSYHPPIIPRGNRLRRELRPGVEGRESGLSGNPDIPDPPSDGPTDLRGRVIRARDAVRALISTLPRVLGLVWSASKVLTIGLAVATVLAGVVPAITAL